jgi:hypothetical protein
MLEREQHHQLGRVAASRGVSMGALIRESVAAYLADVAVEDDPLFGLIGLASDDGPKPHGDVAANADQYLSDLVADEAASERDSRPTRRPRRS